MAAHGSGTSSSELWRSPVAALPLWPVVLTAGILLFLLGPLDRSLLSGSWWRGLDQLVFYALLLWCWWLSSRRRGHSVRDVMGPVPTLALVDARASLGWAIAGAQLVCVPWLVWFVHHSLRQLRAGREESAGADGTLNAAE